MEAKWRQSWLSLQHNDKWPIFHETEQEGYLIGTTALEHHKLFCALHQNSWEPGTLTLQVSQDGQAMAKACVATSKRGEFTVIDVLPRTPRAGEVSIRNKALALNPLDWKKLEYGIMVDSWPAIFGVDIGGVVDGVGEGVDAFKPGDEVFSLAGHANLAGGFQEVSVVPEHFVAHKPPSWTFEEAASLP